MPVPAGMRWPMMMFSLSPSRSSFAPRIAASVRTRVVSWNDAAEMNDCVVRLDLVMPRSNGSLVAGLPPFFTARSFTSRNVSLSTFSPSRNSVSPGSTTRTFCSIWRTITPMCLSLIFTPCSRYTSCTSFRRYSWTARGPLIQDVVRVHGPLGEPVARPHPVALVDAQVLPGRHLVQLRLALLGVDIDLALAALDVPEPHRAVDLGDGGRVLGPPGLEQLGHPRQAARDVARLVRLARHLGQHQARVHLLAVLDRELRALGDDEVAQPLLLFPLLLDDLDVRVQLLLPVLDDHPLAPPGELVELLAHRLVLGDVDEPHHARHVRHDRVGVGVPREEHRVAHHLGAVLDHQGGAEWHVEARVYGQLPRLAVGLGLEDQLALVARHHLLLVGRLDVGQPVAELDHALDLGLAHRLLGDARRRAAEDRK